MKLINLVVGMFLLAPIALNAQSLTAGGNYRGVFGNGQTTVMLQARVMNSILNVTFEVSSRGDDGSRYNQVFSFTYRDDWTTRSGGAIPFPTQAVVQAIQAYEALRYGVQESLNEKAKDLGIHPPFLPDSPLGMADRAFFPDSEQINIH